LSNRKQFGSRFFRSRTAFTRGLAVSLRVTMSDELSDCVQKISLEDNNDDACSSSSSNSSSNSDDFEIEDIEALLKEGKVKNIVMVVGAGISTSAGIPDFRTPGTGLYSNLAKYNLPYPEAVFDIKYFKKKPQAFYTLSKELLPGFYAPTITHHFIARLGKLGLLKRIYTQNIDGLERLAGLDEERLVEAHGSFASSKCTRCKKAYPNTEVHPKLRAGTPMECQICKGDKKDDVAYVKPDIVFFGEGLPERFHDLYHKDLKECDLVIVMGTSLYVYPVAGIPDDVHRSCPRILINRELVGSFRTDKRRTADAFYCGNADDGSLRLAKALGIYKEVKESYKKVESFD